MHPLEGSFLGAPTEEGFVRFSVDFANAMPRTPALLLHIAIAHSIYRHLVFCKSNQILFVG